VAETLAQCSTGTVTLTVCDVNTAAEAADDMLVTLEQSSAATVTLTLSASAVVCNCESLVDYKTHWVVVSLRLISKILELQFKIWLNSRYFSSSLPAGLTLCTDQCDIWRAKANCRCSLTCRIWPGSAKWYRRTPKF